MPAPSVRRSPRTRPALLLLALLAACGRDEITAPTALAEGTVTVDATSWAYLSLAEGRAVTPADPPTSTEWDVAFSATSVMLNGGQAGPGGVVGHCVCQNAATSPTTEQLLAMTAESELADFTAVTAAGLPPASAYASDALTPAITGWHTGAGASAAAAGDRAWLVRLRDGTAYAAVRVAALAGASAATPGRVTLEYRLQPTASAPLGAARTLVVDVPAGAAARVDLLGGATTADATAWDLRFDGWTLRLNGGASGGGRAAAAVAEQPLALLTTAATAAQAYRADAYAGVFAQHPWHRYNLLGDHRVTPTFDVYLVRRGSVVYKLQVTGYYGPAGETRRITVRYEQLAG
jgi:hypothetical protein